MTSVPPGFKEYAAIYYWCGIWVQFIWWYYDNDYGHGNHDGDYDVVVIDSNNNSYDDDNVGDDDISDYLGWWWQQW